MKRSSSGLALALALPLALTLSLGCAGSADAPSGTGEPTGSGTPGSSTASTGPGRAADASTPAAPTGPRAACETYLSCLLAVAPTAYGAAVQLYGDGAACWATSAQTEGCGKACDASFEQIGKQCHCTGTQCAKCDFPFGSFTPIPAPASSCAPTPWSLDVANGAEGPTLRVRFDQSESVELPLACTSPATFSQTIDRGCPVEWTGSISSSGSGVVVTGSKKTNCPGDAPRTCAFTWSATKAR
jgi:hypothetical protein